MHGHWRGGTQVIPVGTHAAGTKSMLDFARGIGSFIAGAYHPNPNRNASITPVPQTIVQNSPPRHA